MCWPQFSSICSSPVSSTRPLRDVREGVHLKYRTDGPHFNLRRLKAKTKTVMATILEALFADDCAMMANKEPLLQMFVNKFAEAANLFCLTVSLDKTEVLLQPAPLSVVHCPCISIESTGFTYLGSVISNDGSLDKEINSRICKASQALGRLKSRVLKQHNIKLSAKLKVDQAVVIPSLLYGCETWTLYRRHIKQLERFHKHSLRSILVSAGRIKSPTLRS